MKRSQGKADLFNDQAGDIKNILNGDVRAKESFFIIHPNSIGFRYNSLSYLLTRILMLPALLLSPGVKTDSI